MPERHRPPGHRVTVETIGIVGLVQQFVGEGTDFAELAFQAGAQVEFLVVVQVEVVLRVGRAFAHKVIVQAG